MKKLKLWVHEQKPEPGWTHIKSFDDFKNLLDTVDLDRIETIDFGDTIEPSDDDDFVDYTPVDCVVHMIQEGQGKALPECIVHNDTLFSIINNYNNTYKLNNTCYNIQTINSY